MSFIAIITECLSLLLLLKIEVKEIKEENSLVTTMIPCHDILETLTTRRWNGICQLFLG